ncbi:hypothetical protein J6590_053033 [Homalodisca vitripennis]|nr:hypothetical protein J6590_053033 [Homalodisca vitripennis]
MVVCVSSLVLVNVPAVDQITREFTLQGDLNDMETDKRFRNVDSWKRSVLDHDLSQRMIFLLEDIICHHRMLEHRVLASRLVTERVRAIIVFCQYHACVDTCSTHNSPVNIFRLRQSPCYRLLGMVEMSRPAARGKSEVRRN